MKEFFGEFVNNIINSNYPLIGLALTAFAESSFFLVPPDLIYIPLAILNPKNALFYAFITTLFSVLGGIFGYFIGKYGGRPLVSRFISDEKLYNVKLFYNKYDVWAVVMGGFTPIPYKIFTVAAGIFDLNLRNFIIASILGRGTRFFLVCGLIYFFGPSVMINILNFLPLSL
ncbi:MAG: YqaA family protein [Microgenomates group bacterium]